MAWSTFFGSRRAISTQMRAYNGKVYEGKVIDGFTNVLGMEVAKVGETASGNGISWPKKQWQNLPLANRPQ